MPAANTRKAGVAPPEEIKDFVAKAGSKLVVVDVRNPDASVEPGDQKSLAVAPLPSDTTRPQAVHLIYDRNTDTISVRATFPNPDGLLLPGQFVRVQIKQKVPDRAIVVPQSAVQKDREGHFVLTVGRDQVVERQRIEVAEQYEGNWVVRHGLLEGQRIIVEGLQKAAPGKAVNAVEKP